MFKNTRKVSLESFLKCFFFSITAAFTSKGLSDCCCSKRSKLPGKNGIVVLLSFTHEDIMFPACQLKFSVLILPVPVSELHCTSKLKKCTVNKSTIRMFQNF